MAWLIVALLVTVPIVVAFLLPRRASAMRSAFVPAPPERVFALATEAGALSSWRRDVETVAVSADGKSWSETARDGETREFAEAAREAGRFVRLSFRSSRGYAGTREGRFEAAGEGSAVSFTESYELPNPILRLRERLSNRIGKQLDAYVDDLRQAATKRAPRR